MIRFEPIKVHHLNLIANNMRERDADEIRAGWDLEPAEAIVAALSKSYYSRALFWDLVPLAIFGLSPISIISNIAEVWVFGTRAIDEHQLAFARASRQAAAMLRAQCSLMTNFVDESDKAALKWMFWLGGTVIMPPQMRGGRPFLQFVLDSGRTRQCQRA